MFLRMVNRFWVLPKQRGLAWRLPLLLALLVTSPMHASAQAPAEPLPCNRIAKVLASGTVADRNALAASFPEATASIVKECRTALERGFGSEIRPHLATPTMHTWRTENQWLAAFLQTVAPGSAAAWVERLDPAALDGKTLHALVTHWAAGSTAATETVFFLLAHIAPETERTRALFDIEPLLLRLEAQGVTTATHTQDSLHALGYPALFSDTELTTLWSLRIAPVTDTAATAYAAMARGNEHEAFRAFARAAAEEPAYFLHTAVLAERLFARQALAPTALLPMGIEYRKCEGGYRVEWGLGKMGKLNEGNLPREFAAEAALRRAFKCGEIIEATTDADTLKSGYAKWRRRFAGTHAEARYRLSSLRQMAAVADKLSREGRMIQGNELREFIYRETLDERPYRFLGGVTQARNLRARVRGYLAFPPEPEVFVNDPLH